MTNSLLSTITCPHCGHKELETMPTDACQFFYDCKGYGVLLKSKQGDCCVFCSFGNIPCPPIQKAHLKGGSKGCCGGVIKSEVKYDFSWVCMPYVIKIVW